MEGRFTSISEVSSIDEDSKLVRSLSQDVKQMKNLVSSVGTPRDSNELRSQISNLSKGAAQKAREAKQRCQSHLKSSNSTVRTQYDRLLRSLMDETKVLTDEQNRFTQLQRRHPISTGLSGGMGRMDGDFGSGEREYGGGSRAAGPGFQLVQEFDEDSHQEQLTRQRHQELKTLEGDMSDLHEMFLEMGTLVADQGEQLDLIEANVETSAIRVERAKEETSKAVTLKQKIRQKKCTLTICCIVLLAVVVAVIVIAVTQS